MRIRYLLRVALDHHRHRRRCEDDANAYDRHPLTEAEISVGDDPRTGTPSSRGDRATSVTRNMGLWVACLA